MEKMNSEFDKDPNLLWKVQRSVLKKMKLHLLATNDLIRALPDLIRLRIFTDQQLKSHDQFKGQSSGKVWHALEEQLDSDRHALPLFLVVLKKYNKELVESIHDEAYQELTLQENKQTFNKTEKSENDLRFSNTNTLPPPLSKPKQLYQRSNRQFKIRPVVDPENIKDIRENYAPPAGRAYAPPAGRAYYSKDLIKRSHDSEIMIELHQSVSSSIRREYLKDNNSFLEENESMKRFNDKRERKLINTCSTIYTENNHSNSNKKMEAEENKITSVGVFSTQADSNFLSDGTLLTVHPFRKTDSSENTSFQRWDASMDFASLATSICDIFNNVIIIEEKENQSRDTIVLSNLEVGKYVNELVRHCIISTRTAWIIRRCPSHSERIRLFLVALSSLKKYDVYDLIKKCSLNKRFIKMLMETSPANLVGNTTRPS